MIEIPDVDVSVIGGNVKVLYKGSFDPAYDPRIIFTLDGQGVNVENTH